MMHTVSDNLLVKQNIAPQDIASGASVEGTGQDCAGYEQLLAVIEVGLATTGNITVKLQESSDNGVADAFADITSATTGAVGTTGDNEPYLIDVNLSEHERYIRAVATAAGGGDVVVGATFVLARGRHLPPTQDNTVVKV
jgi:hypothetical protein